MRGRFSAALAVFAAGAFLASPAGAVTVLTPQTPTQIGISGPAIVAPIGLGGSSLQNGVGTLDSKGILSNLPGVPGLTPGVARPGVAESLPFALPDLGLGPAKMGFRRDVAPPGLPASAIPGATAGNTASQFGVNPAAPAAAAYAVETVADFGLYGGAPLPMNVPEATLKPGPGGGLSVLRRQSLRVGAKAESVAAQLRAAGEAKNLSEEGAQSLGRRVMEVLTEGRSLGSGDTGKAPAGLRHDASPVPARSPEAGLLAFDPYAPSGSGGASVDAVGEPGSSYGTSAIETVPGLRRDGAPQVAVLPAQLQGGVALLALRVYDASLVISVVGVPARRMALRLTQDAALAWTDAPPSLASEMGPAGPLMSELRDAVASPSAQSPAGMLMPGSSAATSAQSEAFSFLQSAAMIPGAASEAQTASGEPTRAGRPSDQSGSAPMTAADPLLAVSLLPLLGLGLILRSRLFY